MASCVLLENENEIEIPLGIQSLGDFQCWSRSDSFPSRGRIDYIGGDLEVDMSPESLFFHGTLKSRICQAVVDRVDELEIGHVFVDSTRITCVDPPLSTEPDIVFVSQTAIDKARVRLVPAASGAPDAFVEIEGPPDLVVEIVSDSSVRKDTERLPKAYFTAGISEYWLIDARAEEISFSILQRGETGFEPMPIDSRGYHESTVLRCWCELSRKRGLGGFWKYSLALEE